jgi:multicomponent Na+:H+ antiporter subunit D
MSVAAHLPALQVVVPLVAAPLTVLLRGRRAAFAIVLLACWVAFAIAVALWLQVNQGGTISYHIGSWPPPWGIEYRVDRLSSYMLVLVTGMAAVVLPYSWPSVERELPRERQYLFYTMFALCLTGLLGIAITGDAFNIFVFLEISSLSTYVLIALGRDRRALLAAYQYLIMGTIGATFIVIGIGLLYLQTGTLNLVDMGQRLHAISGHRPVLAALAFLTVGLSLKLALFPLHQWLPNAYAYAPSAVGESAVFQRLPMEELMLVLALGGMFVASTVACFQTNLKRLFAYSSVAQIGYIVLGLSFDSLTGLTGTVVHLANHAITKGGIFLLLGGVAVSMGGVTLAQVQGLGRTMPLTSFGVVVGGLSLIGVPGTAGFVSKWYLILAALEAGQWWLVFLIVLSSMISVVYVWRFVEAAYFRAPPAGVSRVREAPLSMLLPAGLLVAATVYFGLETSITLGAASEAAAAMIGAGR